MQSVSLRLKNSSRPIILITMNNSEIKINKLLIKVDPKSALIFITFEIISD